MANSTTNLEQDKYLLFRKEFLAEEESKTTGASLALSQEEEFVNEILLKEKWKQLDLAFEDPNAFLGSNHIYDIIHHIERSDIFKIIEMLPKGCSLHSHDMALVSGDYLFSLTFSENLYACITDDKIKLKFMKDATQDTLCPWRRIEELRKTMNNFDSLLKSQLTLIHPENKYLDSNTMWKKFLDCFLLVEPLIAYKPIFEKYFYQALLELHEDNVMYMEFRTVLPTVYDLDGKSYELEDVAGLYKEVADDFLKNHHDFLGVKMIYAPIRSGDKDALSQYIATTRKIKYKYPDFLAGFDLVGQEDVGVTLLEIFEKLYEIKNEVDFFFHAGETNWNGSKVDLNLIDAVLLNTKRIGHAFSLLKHVDVLKVTKKKGIAVECCPISNQVLLGVQDLRQHPASYLIAKDYPVVICNDDPSFWGTKGLSYDWYIAFMVIAGRSAGLRFLKQLAKNSIKYSVCNNKEEAYQIWELKWQKFIKRALSTYSNLLCSCKDVKPCVHECE